MAADQGDERLAAIAKHGKHEQPAMPHRQYVRLVDRKRRPIDPSRRLDEKKIQGGKTADDPLREIGSEDRFDESGCCHRDLRTPGWICNSGRDLIDERRSPANPTGARECRILGAYASSDADFVIIAI